jgi:hypothetical protein
VGGVRLAVAFGIGWDAARRLGEPALLLHPGAPALAVAVLSVVAKEWLHRYMVRVARRVRSALLEANAWHHRSDAIASVMMVHLDPEDDEGAAPNRALPLRRDLIARLHRRWEPVLGTQRSADVVRHYLEGKVSVDLFLPLGAAADRTLRQRLTAAARREPAVGEVRVFFG